MSAEDWRALLRIVRDARRRHGTRAIQELELKVEAELAQARRQLEDKAYGQD